MSTNRSAWRSAISKFLQSSLRVGKYRQLPSLISSLYEYRCYVERASLLAETGCTLSPGNLLNSIFVVHYKPGERQNSSFVLVEKEGRRGNYRLYLNVAIPSTKSTVEHTPDISMYSRTFPGGIRRAEHLSTICECKMKSRLTLGDIREFLGFKMELSLKGRAEVLEGHMQSCIYTTAFVNNNLFKIADSYDFEIIPLI